jgi:hypothetical protein
MNEEERHDEVTRLLREQGPVPAPPELREHVMRRVHDEARARPSRTGRPLLVLLAASLVTLALVGGISRLGGGASSSFSGGGSSPGAAEYSPQATSAAGADSRDAPQLLTVLGPPVTFKQVPQSGARAIRQAYSVPENGIITHDATTGRIDLYVPASQWKHVRARLRELAQATADGRRVTVRLYKVDG